MTIKKDILQKNRIYYKGVILSQLPCNHQLHIKTTYSNYMIIKEKNNILKICGGTKFSTLTPIELKGSLWIDKMIPDWIICGMKFEFYVFESKDFVTTSKVESIMIKGKNFYYELNNF